MTFDKVIEPLLSQATARYIENYIINAGNIEISRAYKEGRDKGFEIFDATGAQYSALMDSKVCEFCAALDGTLIDLRTAEGQALYDKLSPAQHPECRCVWICIFEKSFKADNAIVDKRWEERLRGQLPKDLKGLSRAEIVEKFASYNLNSRWHRWEEDEIGAVIKARNKKLQAKVDLAKRKSLKGIGDFFKLYEND